MVETEREVLTEVRDGLVGMAAKLGRFHEDDTKPDDIDQLQTDLEDLKETVEEMTQKRILLQERKRALAARERSRRSGGGRPPAPDTLSDSENQPMVSEDEDE